MCGRSRAPVDVEGYAQLGKGILDDGMIAVYDILRGDTLFFGLDGDGHSMLVAAADEEHLLTFHAEIAGIDIGRHVDAGQMPDMHRTVGIRQSRSDKRTLEIFHIYAEELVNQ